MKELERFLKENSIADYTRPETSTNGLPGHRAKRHGVGSILKAISPLCLRPQWGTNKTRRKTNNKQTERKHMVIKLEVFKTVHNTWPAKNGMAAGESYDLLCIDVSNPPEHRMEEMLFYRTKPEEREAHYVNGTGKTITVGVAKIRHADKGGKATIIGSIIPEAIKK